MSQSTQTAQPAQITQTAQPRVVPPGAGTMAPAAAPGLPTIEVKLGAADAAGFSLVEYDVPGRFSPPPRLHRHTREGAVAYVLDGELHYWFWTGSSTTGSRTGTPSSGRARSCGCLPVPGSAGRTRAMSPHGCCACSLPPASSSSSSTSWPRPAPRVGTWDG